MLTCEYISDGADAEWEPEPLPLGIELEYPPPTPRHDDAIEDQSSRVIVIDLA
jgi:hypothetical protein